MKMHCLYMRLKYILSVLLIVTGISCNDETLVNSMEETGNGTSVNVRLNFSIPEHNNVITSRVSDYKVNDLYIIVCKENGSVAFSKYYTSTELNDGSIGLQPNTQDENNWVTATIPTGKVYIYAFANVNDDIYPHLEEKLTNIVENNAAEAKKQIENLKIDVAKGTTSLGRPGNTWVMSGTCTDSENVDYYTVTPATTDIKTITLRRLDSIITFNITSGGKCTVFKARRWYVMNAPSGTYVLEHNADRNSAYDNWDASNEKNGFYNSFAENEQDLAEISGNTFTFYMPENRKKGKNISDPQGYRYRELQEDSKPVGEFINGVYVNNNEVKDREFTYAPQYATYVVIMGTYEGTADSEIYGGDKTVSANVIYKIHLGYVDNNPNDFFSERNTRYTYNVRVLGVDNIVVEVETEKEKNPGATGEVIFTEGDNIYTLDAHYETVLLTFKKEELSARNREDFKCIVKTPFTSLSTISNNDVDWVKVVKNDNAAKTLKEYPGDGSEKLQSVEEMLDDLYYATHPNAPKENGYSKDVSKLFTNGIVTYTCYVNEFYYDKKPEGVPNLPDEEKALWKYFVNQPNRLMYIVCNTKLSPDGESSVVSAKYILSQRSIQTIYATDPNNGLTIAYGVETVNESGQLESGNPSSKPTNKVYGWENTWKMVSGKKWNIIDHAKNGYTSIEQNSAARVDGMENDYKYAYISCMQRNRKTASRSDDKIKEGELKWYLPTLQQYQALYIGESGINEEARLYNYDYTESYPVKFNTGDNTGDKKGYKHYQSSTYRSGSPEILWSEEGTSNSTLAERNSWGNNAKTPLHIRCVRNLGTVKEEYEDFKSNSGNVIGIPFLSNNTNSRRGTVNGELGEHHNNEDNNRLSETGYFEIYEGKTIIAANIGDATGAKISQDYKGCSSISVQKGERKWRAPNLREFTLMANYGKLKEGDVCRTKFYYSHRKGWYYKTNIITMGNGTYGEGAGIRCVRDCAKPIN